MDGQRFDAIVRGWGAASRRGMLRGMLATGLVGVSRLLHAGPVAAAPPECQTHIDCKGNRFCDTSRRPGRCQACKNQSTICKYGIGEADCCDNATEVCDGGSEGQGCVDATCVSPTNCQSDADCCGTDFCACGSTRFCVQAGSLGTTACCTGPGQCLQTCVIPSGATQGVCCEPGSPQCETCGNC